MKPLFFKDGVQFASGYVRIEHGGRGNYYELTKKQILVELESRFGQSLPDEVKGDEKFHFYWLIPKGRNEKIYWQVHAVDYAYYRKGFYYVGVDVVTPHRALSLESFF